MEHKPETKRTCHRTRDPRGAELRRRPFVHLGREPLNIVKVKPRVGSPPFPLDAPVICEARQGDQPGASW